MFPFAREACLAVAIAFTASTASAWPDKPVRLIVPYAPGGSSDVLGRTLAARLSETMGQQWVIENRAGAGSMLGTDAAAKSAPDGYTFLLADAPHTINPSVYRKIPYDPVADFAPVTLIGTAPLMLFVHPGVQARTVQEFVALAKERPGEIAYGSGGNGASSHLIAELFQGSSTVKLNHVPYKGAGPAMLDTVAGQVQATFTSMATAAPHVKAGKLRVLGSTAPRRTNLAPEVPTFTESGLEGMVYVHWWGLLAPARTPANIVDKLRADVAAALASPALAERMATFGVEPVTNTPSEFRALIESELRRWSVIVRDAGIKVE